VTGAFSCVARYAGNRGSSTANELWMRSVDLSCDKNSAPATAAADAATTVISFR
jgi:hypothetical protein